MPSTALPSRPRLAPHARVTYDAARGCHVLLMPEAVTVLNGTGAAIVNLCDGERTVPELVAELGRRYDHVVEDDVRAFLARLAAARCLDDGRADG